MRTPDPKANTTTEAYLAYKAGYLEESELKPVLYEPYLHFDAWLAYWAGLTDTYPNKGPSNKNIFDGVYENGLINGNTGEDLPNENAIRSKHFIKVSPNTIYRISVENYTGSYFIYEYKADMTYNLAINKTSDSGVFQTNAGTEFVRFRLAVGFTDKTAKTQMEEGNTATEYEPYYAIPEMLTDEEALVAYLSGVTNTYPEEIKDPYDVRIVGYLKHLVSARWPEPDYPVNNQEFYLSTMKPPVVTNDTPSADIELDDTAEAPFIDLKMYGDTSQTTYTGSNLFDRANATENSILTWTGGINYANTGSITSDYISVTEGNFATNYKCVPFFYDSSKTYLGHLNSDGTTIGTSSASDSGFDTFTIPSVEAIAYMRLVFRASSTGNPSDMTDKNIMFNTGSTALEYEPYVGGIPAPSPDYPQPVNVVTGRQTITANGKNLFNIQPQVVASVSGMTNTFNTDGSMTTTGKPTTDYALMTSNLELDGMLEDGETYVISQDEYVENIYLQIQIVNKSTSATSYLSATTEARSFTVNKTLNSYRMRVQTGTRTNWGDAVRTYRITYQLEKGSTATTCKPYEASSYEINLGKNLFNGILEEGIINGNTGQDAPNSSYVRSKDYIPVEELTNYSISSTNADIEQFLVYEYKADYSYNLSANRVVQKGSYWQTKEGTKYIRFRPGIISNDTSMKFQIEVGTTATEYAPYFEPIELCKISTAQDYIYQDADGDWYVVKNVGKDVLDGNEANWSSTTLTTGNRMYVLKNEIGLKNQNGVGTDMCSDHFISVDYATYYAAGGVNGISYSYYQSNHYVQIFNNGIFTGLEGLKTWLQSHPVTYYYVLANSVETLITDNNLIAQLNALKEGGSYEGKTRITVTATSPNLPALLKVEAGEYR